MSENFTSSDVGEALSTALNQRGVNGAVLDSGAVENFCKHNATLLSNDMGESQGRNR